MPSLPRPAALGRVPRRSAIPRRSLSTVGRSITTTPFASHEQPTSSASASSSSKPTSASTFSTINASEISHFSSLSSQWWSETGEFALLHRMNPVRVEYIRNKVALSPSSSPSYTRDESDEPEWTFSTRHSDLSREISRGTGLWLKDKRCLDVGCGGGLLSESLARLGGRIIGVDASSSNIGIATTHASQDPFLATKMDEGLLEYRHSSAEDLRDQGEKFDVVCAMEVLEHVDQPGEFLKCLGEMVKPGGHLIISTISRTPLSQLLTLTLAEDVLKLVSKGTHTYSKFVRPEELRRFIYTDMGGHSTWRKNEDSSDVRFDQVGTTQGIVYDPLSAQWRLWDGTEGTWKKWLGEGCNYMYHARKI